MRIDLIKQFWIIFLLSILLSGCVEPIEIRTETFESVLVVEGVITDEDRKQEIFLSRTFLLEDEGPSPESNAEVIVRDDFGREFLFEELTPGKYVSLLSFKAERDREYTLEILTEDNKIYRSEPETMPEPAAITNIVAERVDYQKKNGIALLLDVRGPEDTKGFYRYTYEETYKIISPFSYPLDLKYVNGDLIEVPKTKEEKVCYNTRLSEEIILATTGALVGNSLERFVVHFIESNNPILSHRYSILIKQFAISPEAHSFYEVLKDFSGSESLFSQNQPGFINGNIFSVSNAEEKVIGFFSVAAVQKERIFFDFEDFYTQAESPGHLVDCMIYRPRIAVPEDIESLGEMLASGRVKYLGYTEVAGDLGEGPYMIADAACVDCTVLGTNKKPDFWEE